MGIATPQTAANKTLYASYLENYWLGDSDALRRASANFYSADAMINVVQPINAITGAEAFNETVVLPLQRAFRHLHRRTDMLFGGEYQGAEWVVSHGHYVGEFVADWLGIPANEDIVRLHYIEYHRIEDDRSVESYLYLDMLDLLRQLGRWPLPPSRGYEGFVPGPATGDGIRIGRADEHESQRSLSMVDDMLSRLYTNDEAWRPYWSLDMAWYGPSGYGSYLGVDGFARFQLPYEAIFEEGRVRTTYRKSNDATLDAAVTGHYARFADGDYVASGGWPSHGGFLVNDWLGVTAAGQMFTVRVADVWRRQGDRLAENWVFVDIVDMLLQLGVDVFAAAEIEVKLP